MRYAWTPLFIFKRKDLRMALVKVHKIMLRCTTDSYTYKTMYVSDSSFDSFELNPCSYEKQSINFYTYSYSDIGNDGLYNFIIGAARGNSANDGLVVYANPNLDIYFFASDGAVCRGRVTGVNTTFPPKNSTGIIHLEFYLYHNTNPMTTRRLDIGGTMIIRSLNGSVPGIDRIIFNNPATIVYWTDGTKTVVKAHDEEFSEEHGLAMAFARKVLETSYGNEHPRAGFKRLVREATRY